MIFIILATNYSILSNIIISLKKLGQFLLSKLVLLEFNSFNKNTKLHENQHQPYSHSLTAFGAGSFLLYFILMFLKVYPKQKKLFFSILERYPIQPRVHPWRVTRTM